MLTSSGGAGTTPTTTRYKRTNIVGARRVGGAASTVLDAGKVTPRIIPPTGGGIVPGGGPCFPEWSTDAGTVPSDPDDDILTLVRDALTLTFVRDALTLCPRPAPTPDLLQGTRWDLGMAGLVMGATPLGDKVRTSGASQGRGELTCGLSRAGALTLLLALTPDNLLTKIRQPPKDHAHARNSSAPRQRRG